MFLTEFLSPTATGTYTVTGTDANGCSNTGTVDVTVNALPTVDAGADVTICDGGSVTLSGSGAVTYSWDNNVSDGVLSIQQLLVLTRLLVQMLMGAQIQMQ